MINHFYILFKILNLTLLALFIIFVIYVYTSYKFKEGDKIMWPPYKKTFYKKDVFCDYNFKPYFNKIKKNMEENKNIKHYKWFYYYDENTKFFSKVELVCYYRIGKEKKIWVFEMTEIFYKDKTGIKHLSFDLILARYAENLLAGNLYIEKTSNWRKDKNFEVLKDKNNELIGYNIHTGHIQYEIILCEN